VSNFGAYILDPEVPKLLNGVLHLGCPATPAEGRTDIVGLLSPNGTKAADLLRINITRARPTRCRTSPTAARSPTT
jgi:hypothetical protein